jgi:hypothetical protein
MNPILAAIQAHLGGGAHVGPPAGGVPPALMGAIHAGAPAGGPPGLPPELMAALGHGLAPVGGPGSEAPPEEQNEDELLSKIINDIHSFLKVASDEDDKVTAATCLASFQKLRAKDQSETDGAMQGKVSPRLVRKTAAAQGGTGGGY